MHLDKSAKGALLVGGVAGIGLLAYWVACKRRIKRLDEIRELTRENVHIADLDSTELKIQQLIKGGKQKLQVVTDFDNTLSRYYHNGKKCPGSHNVLEVSPLMPESFKQQSAAICNTYYPVEKDHEKTMEEKYPYMVEWWTKAHELLVQHHVTLDIVRQSVQMSDLLLKEDYKSFFHQLNRHRVPLLIFSAGLGDIIEEVIKYKSQLYNNIKIISNYMDFNHRGNIVGFRGDTIHIYNKNESSIKDSTYFDDLKSRTNIILLGDSIGDVEMADGAPAEHILKIGYLNYHVDELLPEYKRNYDIVLVGDETLDVINALLRHIL